MAVSLPSCGVKVAIVSSAAAAATCARARGGGGRGGESSSAERFHGWRELALQVVECAGKSHALSRFGSGGERRSRNDRFARCAVVRLLTFMFWFDVRGIAFRDACLGFRSSPFLSFFLSLGASCCAVSRLGRS